MKRMLLLCLLSLLFMGCNEPVIDGKLPEIYWVKFSPAEAKVGDIIEITYEKDAGVAAPGLNLNTDYKVTNGQIKYVGNHPEIAKNYPDEESRIMKHMLYIDPNKNHSGEHKEDIEVTEFVSASEKEASVSDRKIVAIEFKVPPNAKSGYIEIRYDCCSPLSSGFFSEEKLIIVDENGNEITE